MVIVIIDPMEILTRIDFFAAIVLSCPAIWITIVIHLAHKQYSKNHPKPISKDAQIRGLKSCVVNQQTTINDYKKTVADLVRAFALKKAKKQLALAVVLGLFVISIVNPAPSLMPLAIGNELNEKPFFAAGDGSQSSDSIYSFAETLPDDTLYYPDYEIAYPMTEFNTAADFEGWTEKAGFEFDSLTADGSKVIAETAGDNSWHILEHSVDYGVGVEGYTFWIKAQYNYSTNAGMRFVLVDSGAAVNTTIVPISTSWLTSEVLYYSDEGAIDSLEVWVADYTDPLSVEIDFIYFNSSALGYSESFFDVSDWGVSLNEAGESITTDDDVVTLAAEGDSSADRDNFYTNSPSLSSWEYIEIRYKMNSTAGYSWTVYILDADSHLTDEGRNSYKLTETLTWRTDKWYIDDYDGTLEDYDGKFETIIIQGRNNEGIDTECYVEYIRVGSADEFGWQHDCSTTEGFDYQATRPAIVFSSDGDLVTCNPSGDDARVEIAIDTTATQTKASEDYYDLIEFSISSVTDGDADGQVWKIRAFESSTVYSVFLDAAWSAASGVFRYNLDALTIDGGGDLDEVEYFKFYLDDADDILVFDYIKLCSLANHTVTQDSDIGIDEYLYVDSSALHFVMDGDDSDYIRINYDPAISVSDTYSVVNLTISNVGAGAYTNDYCSRYYTPSAGSWTYDETRLALPGGTVTDFDFHCYESLTLSAIKFIEDGTAPDILDKFIDPGEPYDDETVTIMTVAYDGQEVYKCTINAVVCPAAFSDVDYEMTETDQEHVFTYEFSTLAAGYYLFQIKVSDGANTYEEYISVRVREAEIVITTYTFFGASSDFSFMQFSGYISHDCTYNISEWSASWPVNETHTGSVSEGMFNIAWDKIGVDDLEANFTIVFVNGSLSKTVPGYYGTAYKELRITEIKVHNPEESQAITNITVNFYTNKDIDWFVYDVDDNDAVLASGSSVEGSDVLRWLKDRTPFIHNYAIKWTDGVSNIWRNNSYWTYRENIDSIDQPGLDAVAADKRRTIEFWTTLTAIVVIVGFAVIGISHYNLDKKIKALQLPHYKTQEK